MQCRGIVLCKDTNQPVCLPFHKFFDLGEKQKYIIEWITASAYEKADGSLIKVRHTGAGCSVGN